MVSFSLLATVAPAQTLTKIHDFGGSDGNTPSRMALIQGIDGNFYGTTRFGGTTNNGAIFKTTPDGTTTLLYGFTGGTDGAHPESGLVQDAQGNFYGTTRTGGPHCCGTVYKLSPQGVFTTLYGFSGTNDGSGAYSPLLLAADGNLYGVTYTQGANGGGTIYKITTSGTLTTLYGFCAVNGMVNCQDGKSAIAGLIQDAAGNIYGETTQGGDFGHGTVFRLTPGGTYSVLHSFQFATDGDGPQGRLVQSSTDGNLYGTTYLGGVGSEGTVFRLAPDGSNFAVVFTFCLNLDCSAGYQPEAGLVQGADGNFYGTSTGGSSGHGTVYRVTPGGMATALYTFCTHSPCNDGSGPLGELLIADSGIFYGATSGGGTGQDGTLFKLTTANLVPTTTTLTSAPNPSSIMQLVVLTATVHAQNGSTPTGNVVFKSNGTSIGSAPLDGHGVATLDYVFLSLGTFSLTAVYQGSATLAPSTSNTVQQVVQGLSSVTTVHSVPNPSTVGQQVTITATVGPNGPPMPTGTVNFTSNGGQISGCALVPLSSGSAQCVTSALDVGTDAVVATYSGDTNYAGSSGTLAQIVNPVPSPLQFVSVSPCRIVDTRNPNGPFGGPPIPARMARSFPLSEGDNPCGIPSSAVAYSLNVTVVPLTTLNFLTIWPTGEGQPTVSTLNAPDGRTKANAAIVPAGAPGGGVSVYVTQTTNVIIDINGYFKPADGTTLQFYPVTPCRVADTRNPNGPLGGPPLMGTVERDFPVLSSTCNLPNTAVAYSLNFTAVPLAGHLGFLTVWPQGQTRPTVSTLNDPTGTTVANAAIVPAGTSGGIATYASQDTNLIIDVNGYFAPPGTGGLSLYVLTPCRVLDTRNGNGAFSGELTVHVMSSLCEVTGSALAYVFNATVLPVHNLGFLTLWPDGEQQPTVSTLNAPDGAITSNMAIVPTNNGSIDAYASQATQLILDISSYFAP
jgi:uncharacterized repeat protein (TIGR03803 family)